MGRRPQDYIEEVLDEEVKKELNIIFVSYSPLSYFRAKSLDVVSPYSVHH